MKNLGRKEKSPDLAENGLRSIGGLLTTQNYNLCRVQMRKRSQVYRLLFVRD